MKYLYLYFVYSLFIMKFSLWDNSTLLYYRCAWATVELWKCSDKIEKDSTLNFSGSGILVVGWDTKIERGECECEFECDGFGNKTTSTWYTLSLVFGLATYTQDVNCGFDFLLFEHSIRMVGFIICSKMNYFPKRVVVLLLFLSAQCRFVLCIKSTDSTKIDFTISF